MIHLVDNSVWQRIAQPVVFEAMSALSRSGTLAATTPQMLEYGHSARNPRDYDILMQKLESLVMLIPDVNCHKQAMTVQHALWHNAEVRGAGVRGAGVQPALDRTPRIPEVNLKLDLAQ